MALSFGYGYGYGYGVAGQGFCSSLSCTVLYPGGTGWGKLIDDRVGEKRVEGDKNYLCT
jgi:hypothetical protein